MISPETGDDWSRIFVLRWLDGRVVTMGAHQPVGYTVTRVVGRTHVYGDVVVSAERTEVLRCHRLTRGTTIVLLYLPVGTEPTPAMCDAVGRAIGAP